jgi:hypothetical protein
MKDHNYILKIIEETLDDMIRSDKQTYGSIDKKKLCDYIFTLLADKYSNNTVYARTQTIDLQLKADVIRELGPAIEHLKKQDT